MPRPVSCRALAVIVSVLEEAADVLADDAVSATTIRPLYDSI